MLNIIVDSDDHFTDDDYLPPSSPVLTPFKPNLQFEPSSTEDDNCSSDADDGELDIVRDLDSKPRLRYYQLTLGL